MVDRALTESDLRPLLESTFLESLCFLDETDSTNRQAIRLLSEATLPAAPCLVYAESQTAGKGRGANRWWSSSGSLTFSLIVDTQQFGWSPEQLVKLPLLAGVALLKTGQTFIEYPASQGFALKWPNDVYLAGRKLAGILIEVPAAKTADCPAVHAVIGIGLNVNNTWSDAPPELRGTGVSLRDESDRLFDRVEVLGSVLGHFQRLIESLSRGEPVLDGWSEHCLLTGKRVTILVGEKEVSGQCHGLAPSGALILETDRGAKEFMGGVVKSWS